MPSVLTLGFCCAEVKPPGPVHAQVTPFVGELPLNWNEGIAHVNVPPEAVAFGGALSKFTTAIASASQPLEGLNTVSVYVPLTVTTGSSAAEVKPLGPAQDKVTPGVVEPPSNMMEVLVQLMVPPAAVALGTLESGTTVAVAVEVQPFAGFVTVRVYTPILLTVGFCEPDVNPPGPAHANVAPGVVEAPEITVLLEAQVIIPPVADALGATKSPLTVAVAVEVQLFTGFVTVSVYVPTAVAVGFC